MYFLLGDFNFSLLNCYNHNLTNMFLDSLASNCFVPYILQPSLPRSHSKTLVHNIFSNIISPKAISGNLNSTTSDHLPQFMIAPNVFCNPTSNKANSFEIEIAKEIVQILIKKTLFLITYLLIRM